MNLLEKNKTILHEISRRGINLASSGLFHDASTLFNFSLMRGNTCRSSLISVDLLNVVMFFGKIITVIKSCEITQRKEFFIRL